MAFILTSILLMFGLVQDIATYSPWLYNGSTPSLNNIIIGRCWEYQILERDNRLDALTTNVNCTDVWNLLHKAVGNKDPCTANITRADYVPLFKEIQNKKKLTNKSMFWSGTRSVVHEFTLVNNDYVTLEDSFVGYVANDLRWCGCSGCKGGINYEYCNKTCPDVTKPYWDMASENFAKKADGIVFVMVNGSSKGFNTAYYNGSTFGRVELPTLGNTKQVKLLTILVVFDLDEKPKETCTTGSLLQLYDDARKFGINNIDCIDNPRMVNSILCAKYPHAYQCRHAKNDSNSTDWKPISIAMIAVALVLLLIAIVLLAKLMRRTNQFSGTPYIST